MAKKFDFKTAMEKFTFLVTLVTGVGGLHTRIHIFRIVPEVTGLIDQAKQRVMEMDLEQAAILVNQAIDDLQARSQRWIRNNFSRLFKDRGNDMVNRGLEDPELIRKLDTVVEQFDEFLTMDFGIQGFVATRDELMKQINAIEEEFQRQLEKQRRKALKKHEQKLAEEARLKAEEAEQRRLEQETRRVEEVARQEEARKEEQRAALELIKEFEVSISSPTPSENLLATTPIAEPVRYQATKSSWISGSKRHDEFGSTLRDKLEALV